MHQKSKLNNHIFCIFIVIVAHIPLETQQIVVL